MLRMRINFSRGVLIRMVMLATVMVFGLTMERSFITDFYLRNQLTPVGIIVNGGIVGLFLLGLARVIATLMRYMGEEAALAKFVRRMNHKDPDALAGLSRKSIIYQRYETMRALHEQQAPVNHAALASTLLADESTHITTVRFINNILILTGVFGTIVSLSMALLGASDMFDSVEAVSNMGLVVHGMSTALSTTMTAIVCYLFFGYFFFKLTDAQTHLVSAVEQVTSYYLVPRFTSGGDRLVHDLGNLVGRLRLAAEGLVSTQATHAEVGARLMDVVRVLDERVDRMSDDIDEVKCVLREGFRLPASRESP